MNKIRCPRCGEEFKEEDISLEFEGMCPRCLGNLARDVATAAPEPSDSPLAPGARFRGYEILEILGRGGMGVVYKARQIELDRRVALKVLSPKLSDRPNFATRFHREAKALAALDHPNIIRVIDYGREGDLYFFTMELVDGVSLGDLIRDSKLPPKEVLAIIPQICDALEYAHGQGVVHRDIKPDNILIDKRGRVKIADFGLAKMHTEEATPVTRTGAFIGTPRYSAPEQFDNPKGADHRVDIYSLGVVFYEMLTGEVPQGRFDPPSKRVVVDVRLDDVVLKAMERDPERRYQRAEYVRTDVDTIVASPRAAPSRSSARAILAVGACALLAAAAGILFLLRGKGSSPMAHLPVVPPPAYANDTSPLGAELVLDFWGTEIAFKDLSMQASPWVSQPVDSDDAYDDKRPFVGFLADGTPLLNPGQAAGRIVCTRIQGHYPGGLYTCRYEGKGDLDFRDDAAVVARQPGRISIKVTPGDNGIRLKLLKSDPADPIRNIRILPPGFENDDLAQPFHPAFLERLARFRVLRFHDWQRTADTTLQNWADRPRPNGSTQVGPRGVALEYMIQLCNLLHAEPWFCMPHLATDDFVRRFAAMVRDKLDPVLKVCLEYSGGMFVGVSSTSAYAVERGLALGLSADKKEAGLRFYSQRSVEIFRIWREVFGSDRRLVRVLASLSAEPAMGTAILDWKDGYKEADAVAIEPVFGIRATTDAAAEFPELSVEKVEKMSVAQVLAASEDSIATEMKSVSEIRSIAEARGLVLVAYQGGQYLLALNDAAKNATVTSLFVQANRVPAMGTLYSKFLDGWKKAGGRLFVHYLLAPHAYNETGSWGALEWFDQPSSPKYDALMEFARKNPRWW